MTGKIYCSQVVKMSLSVDVYVVVVHIINSLGKQVTTLGLMIITAQGKLSQLSGMPTQGEQKQVDRGEEEE